MITVSTEISHAPSKARMKGMTRINLNLSSEKAFRISASRFWCERSITVYEIWDEWFPRRGHLIVTEIFVEGTAVVSHQSVGLDVLLVGPEAVVGLVALLVFYFHLKAPNRSRQALIILCVIYSEHTGCVAPGRPIDAGRSMKAPGDVSIEWQQDKITN